MEQSAWSQEDVYMVAERAHALYLQGYHREAAVLFEGLAALDPRNAYCHDALAATYLAMGQPQQAVVAATNALRVEPNHADSRARRCEAYLQLQMFGPARQDLEALRLASAGVQYARLQLRLRNATGGR